MSPDKSPDKKSVPVLLVTGMSGAGKTSALKALEDMGYEAVDNLPLSLLMNLLQPGFPRPIAIGVDIRTRDFGVDALVQQLDSLIKDAALETRMVFIDCDDEELERRYEETRHRHPLAQDRPVTDGIAHERQMISALRARSDTVIDTTDFGPGELKRILEGNYGLQTGSGLEIFVTSFAYRQGLPREADLVFDVRFLRNPHYDADLKPLSGKDKAVQDFVSSDPGFDAFFVGLTGWLLPLLSRYTDEGKSYLTLAVGCTGGRHRSVFMAEKLAHWLKKENRSVHLLHRDMEKA
ncbi:MAG: RNase adapter RapZ [Rhodospirillaceae bacterium]|jgi:RNase adapter protein RapZ|nr:RNase adapter RapZ [Rhodospirillaceae bacterium]MBT4218569.1 RNase adapter RapZ [Rhodospirillaceae bacterium]MBT5014756.1 RNase adapter RapZ [Rhodospirillaceae bacterium]MBT5308400.1 RNase adapter RapZ [Rhodospirillaceae bacterium]MBT7356810.1 RNase adapter RapZ [Rhodospirillaceae bacterium]